MTPDLSSYFTEPLRIKSIFFSLAFKPPYAGWPHCNYVANLIFHCTLPNPYKALFPTHAMAILPSMTPIVSFFLIEMIFCIPCSISNHNSLRSWTLFVAAFPLNSIFWWFHSDLPQHLILDFCSYAIFYLGVFFGSLLLYLCLILQELLSSWRLGSLHSTLSQ